VAPGAGGYLARLYTARRRPGERQPGGHAIGRRNAATIRRRRLVDVEALSPVAASRFNLWLLQQERAGRVYSEAQKTWLRAIRDHIAANAVIAPQDLMEAPDFAALGRLDRADALFGAQLPPLLEELPQVLVA
jgi:hypothetical protein